MSNEITINDLAVGLDGLTANVNILAVGLDGLTANVNDLALAMKKGFDAVDARFDAIDKKFNAVDARFNEVDARFNEVDARFNEVDARFEQNDEKFKGIYVRLDEMNHNIALNGDYIVRVERKLDLELAANRARLERHELRLDILEKQ